LVLVGAIPAASWFMVFKPQGARIATDAAGLAHMEEMLEKLRAETARAADLERENAEIAGRIASIESRLPTNKQIDDVVRQVSVLAVQAGLAPPTLKVERPVAAADYREQPLKLTTSGDWSGYHGFLEKLERLPRITRVTDLSAKESTVGEGVEVDFTLSIYFRQEDGEANS
jgi:Tfp pilus assembly protein PilO